MSEKCRYGRDSEVFYYDPEKDERVKYECPREGKENGFCILHDENYWKQNKECEENVRNAFWEEFERAKKGEKLLCIGYHLPNIEIISESDLPIRVHGKIHFDLSRFQKLYLWGVEFTQKVVFDATQILIKKFRR